MVLSLTLALPVLGQARPLGLHEGNDAYHAAMLSSRDDDSGDTMDYVMAGAIGLIGGLIIALIVTGSMKAAMNTARKKTEATSYVRPGSFHVSQRHDQFLYEQTTSVRKEKDDDHDHDRDDDDDD